jgi:hypothetical protein
MAVIGAVAGGLAVAGAISGPGFGHTHLDLTDVDLADLRQIRDIARARVVEMRSELDVLEAELAVLDEALEEAERDRPEAANATDSDADRPSEPA